MTDARKQYRILVKKKNAATRWKKAMLIGAVLQKHNNLLKLKQL